MNNEQNKFQSFKNNSLNGQSIHKKNITREKIQKDILKKKLIKCSLYIGLIAGTFNLATSVSTAISNAPTVVIDEYIDENGLNIVSRNTHRTEDNRNYYYSHQQIAKEILRSDNQEFLIYICFREMDSKTYEKYSNQEVRNMDDVFYQLNKQSENDSVYKEYDSFKEYLIKSGYSNNNGDPDYKMYDHYMQERLLRIIQNEKGGKAY